MNALTIPKREEKRSRIFLNAQVVSGAGPTDVRIRDVSKMGALLESDTTPEPGENIQVQCGQTRLEARVAWVDRGWFGVEFETPLLVGRLADAGGAKLKVSAPRGYRSGELPR
ncbi:MAG TPA: PilZ domain-containing protein [Sphingomicrobium sp.]|nr:PilZ domain-containing protein [Sphingomicrobium sp.]